MENKNKAWTLGEEKYLIDNHILSVELLAHELKRTKHGVKARIEKLKLEGRIKESKHKARKSYEIFQWEKRDSQTR